MMNLTPIELENLKDFRFWGRWCEAELPEDFLRSLSPPRLNLLIHSLQQFQIEQGLSTSLYPGGALIFTRSIEEHLFKQLKDLLFHNIKFAHLVSCDHPKTKRENKRFVITNLTFQKKSSEIPTGFSLKSKQDKVWKLLRTKCNSVSKAEFSTIVNRLDKSFLDIESENFIVKNVLLYKRSLKDINVKVEIQREANRDEQNCIALVMRRSSRTGFFLNLLRVFYFHKFPILEARSVYVPCDGQDETILIHFYIRKDRSSHDNYNIEILRMMESLSIVQWYEFENPFNREYVYTLGFSIHHAILLRSFEEFIYQMLVTIDSNLYTPERIHEAFTRHPDITTTLIEYFSSKFNPVLFNREVSEKKREDLWRMIDRVDSGIVVNDERRKTVLQLSVKFIDRVLKTNYYVIRRSGLSFKLDPRILDDVPIANRESLYPELPFSIFYIKGKNFIAFNIRFRDFSRGGVRTLLPLDDDQLHHQQKQIFRECYFLARTQQYKNKDIPEGGAKSIIFVKPYLGLKRELALEKEYFLAKARSKQSLGQMLLEKRNTLIRRQLFDAQKSFCDTMLDLLVWDQKTNKLEKQNIVDLYKKEELIYLGPDENMTDQMIEWICDRSVQRRYRVGGSFMSGKKDSGINHKEFGVTSLGVHEYLKEVLKEKLKDPETFSLKIAGGPDGDVAGNEILNIVRDYKKRAKILCVQDGTAIVYDPLGLEGTELKRLFRKQQGVAHYDLNKLNNGAFQLLIHEKRSAKPGVEEVLYHEVGSRGKHMSKWIKASEANGIYHHFLHQLKTDIFIPCGGRPRTLGDNNWEEFLQEDGEPTSKAIIEGANLYLSDGARKELEQRGVFIIKDASGNKCGVICSSYEVLATTLVDVETFSRIKNAFIKDVLSILKNCAKIEARLLLDHEEESGVIALSDKISERINFYTDLIKGQLHEMRENKEHTRMLNRALMNYIPRSIREVIGINKLKKLPQVYQDAIISSSMAAKWIYEKGIDFEPSIAHSLIAELKIHRK